MNLGERGQDQYRLQKSDSSESCNGYSDCHGPKALARTGIDFSAHAALREDRRRCSFASACGSSQCQTQDCSQRPALPSAAARISDASGPAAADEHPSISLLNMPGAAQRLRIARGAVAKNLSPFLQGALHLSRPCEGRSISLAIVRAVRPVAIFRRVVAFRPR